jgi:hypothetical protein
LGAEDFDNFSEDGYAKTCANFLINEQDDNTILLTTETRTKCYGLKAKSFFTFYWAAIRPFSGITRHLMLNNIKTNAESDNKMPTT